MSMSSATQNTVDKMNKETLIKIIIEWVDKNSSDIPFWANDIGVRYDEVDYKIGDELPNSRCYIDGVAEEDQDLPGTSVWPIAQRGDDADDVERRDIGQYLWSPSESPYKHCSIVIGNNKNDDADEPFEALFRGAEVVYRIF